MRDGDTNQKKTKWKLDRGGHDNRGAPMSCSLCGRVGGSLALQPGTKPDERQMVGVTLKKFLARYKGSEGIIYVCQMCVARLAEEKAKDEVERRSISL
jgi:hypothetical protein